MKEYILMKIFSAIEYLSRARSDIELLTKMLGVGEYKKILKKHEGNLEFIVTKIKEIEEYMSKLPSDVVQVS